MQDIAARKILSESGLRATAPRVAVIEFLQKCDYPLSIKDLGEKFAHIDQVTLYRMMETFTVAGFVSRIDLGDGVASFEFKDERDHHHIICVDCKKIEDFTDAAHEKLQKKILAGSKSFAKIVSHSFEIFALCRSCVKKQTLA